MCVSGYSSGRTLVATLPDGSSLCGTTYYIAGTLYYTSKTDDVKKQGAIEYSSVSSYNKSDYPSDGYQDGYWYVLQED